MKTIVFMNLKGGVAKTTTTVNAAAILARDCKQSVLVVDADSQCNTTEFFSPPGVQSGHGTHCTFADLLRRTDVGPVIRPSSFPHVDLLPADDTLMDLDLSKVEGKAVDINCLRRLLKMPRYNFYDWVLIDCPPSFNAAAAAALLAADQVVIPIKLDAFSLRGMANLQRQIHNMTQINRGLAIAGFLPTMAYKSKTLEEAAAALKKSGLPVFSPIRRSAPVDNMTFSQEPLIVSSPKSAACQDYRRFVKELMEGGADRGV